MQKRTLLDNPKTNVLKPEELKEMFLKLNNLEEGSAEYDTLVGDIALHNIRLVLAYGERYKKSIEVDDLLDIGYFGVEKAVKNFDINLGVPFSSYAKQWIEVELRRKVYAEISFFELSKREHEMQCKYFALAAKFEEDNHRAPEFDDIAPLMNLTEGQEKRLRLILCLSVSVSLDNNLDDDSQTTILDRCYAYDENAYTATAFIKQSLDTTEYNMLLAFADGEPVNKIAKEFDMPLAVCKRKLDQIKGKLNNEALREMLYDDNRLRHNQE